MGEIGDTLRERRIAEKIDVQQVEEATKIRAKYLRALENEEFDLLPGPAYVKSFLRTYADHLGLDGRHLVDVYRRDYDRGDASEQPIFPGRPGEASGEGPHWVRIVLLLLVIVAAAVIAVGLLTRDEAGAMAVTAASAAIISVA